LKGDFDITFRFVGETLRCVASLSSFRLRFREFLLGFAAGRPR